MDDYPTRPRRCYVVASCCPRGEATPPRPPHSLLPPTHYPNDRLVSFHGCALVVLREEEPLRPLVELLAPGRDDIDGGARRRE